MAELPASDIPSIVHGALKVIGQVTTFVNAMRDLTEQHEQLRERFEREQEELREREAAARRESEEAAEALAELRAAYEALLTEHETCSRTLHRLREERSELLEGRRQMAEELGAVIGSLRSSRAPVAPRAATPEA